MAYVLKILISAIVIVVVSEVAKRSSFWAALLASLPLTSLIAFVFLYTDTGDVGKVVDLSKDIFWLVIPSLVLFLAFPFLIKKGLDFLPSLILSSVLTMAAYFVMSMALKKFGIM